MQKEGGDEPGYTFVNVEKRKLIGLSIEEEIKHTKKTQTRVVSISDTHLVHDQILLPYGDVLVHAGDIMTESKLRHVKGEQQPKDGGVELFDKFAQWFCSRPHPYKVLIAGNHDGCLEAMGAAKIRQILAKYTEREGSVVYLEHETAQLGEKGLKVFGSPFGHWGSHNDAFSMGNRDYKCVEQNTDIFITHYPPILPAKRGGGCKEHYDIVKAVENSGAALSVSGHCHWAYGLYFSSKKKIPFVVASSCDSGWKRFMELKGTRHDKKWDYLRGGYNVRFAPIVCDLDVAPSKDAVWVRR
jgi:calcineurin-like phosphoesterase family protein